MVVWRFSSLLSSAVGRFGFFLGGPIKVAEALRLLDPVVNCEDNADMFVAISNLPVTCLRLRRGNAGNAGNDAAERLIC